MYLVFGIRYSDFAFGYYYVVTSTLENVQYTKHKIPNTIMQITIYINKNKEERCEEVNLKNIQN